MMSAPSAIIARARDSAWSGAMNSPPSEKESGVTLSTPITAGIGRSSSVRSASSPAGATDGEGEAFMRPALRGRGEGVKTGGGATHATLISVTLKCRSAAQASKDDGS